MPHFGFDLDNTLIDYSESCRQYALLNCLPPVSNVQELKKLLRRNLIETDEWTAAQSWIYGEGLKFANLSFYSLEFVNLIVSNKWEVSIHSHKSMTGPEQFGKVPIRELMQDWINRSKLSVFFTLGSNLHFYDNLNAKISGIKNSKLTHYIDDLPKVFLHELYPRQVCSFLYRTQDKRLTWVNPVSNFQEIVVD